MTLELEQPDPSDRERAIHWLRDNLGVGDDQLVRLDDFVRMLLAESQEQNLIAAATRKQVWTRHVLDSAQLLRHVPRETSAHWIDLGSGAGLPGIILAILRPADSFLLVERRPLRVSWLERAIVSLQLSNATVRGAAVGALEQRKFDVITARAFAPMPKLLAMAARFATKDTIWILPKGRSATEELKTIPSWRERFHVEPSVTDSESGIIVGSLDPALIPKTEVRR